MPSSSHSAAAAAAATDTSELEASATANRSALASPPLLLPPLALYRDALQSVLAFLPLSGLAAALRVSRGWAATVRTMPSAGAPFDLPELGPLLQSPALARHVGQLGKSTDKRLTLPAAQVSALSQLCPQLRTLFCWIQFPRNEVTLSLPSSLRQLDIYITGDGLLPYLSDVVLPAIATLQQLQSLSLRPLSGATSLAPLRHLPLLRVLHIRSVCGPSDSLLADLRTLDQLEELDLDVRRKDEDSWFGTLLAPSAQPPQWRSLSFGSWKPNDDVGPLLCALPALERLELNVCRLSAFRWLAALPALCHLSLSMWNLDEALWAALLSVFTSGGLARLRSLTLYDGPCSSADLAQLLPCLPQLERLKLHSLERVDTLAFLELPLLARSLTHLTVRGHYEQRLTAEHLQSLLGLQQLQYLRLLQYDRDAPDALTAEHLAPFEERPCRVLPQLRVFEWEPYLDLFD